MTDSFGGELAPLHDGLGLLNGSSCPHYHDPDGRRRPAFQRLVAGGELADGWAADDGAALVFDGPALQEVVASRPDATAYRVERGQGGVSERQLPARGLGA